MPYEGTTLLQRIIIGFFQVVTLSVAVFLGFLFSGLGMNPFAAFVHTTLLPLFLFVAGITLIGVFWPTVSGATSLAAYALVATFPVHWILCFASDGQSSPAQIMLLSGFLILMAMVIGLKFHLLSKEAYGLRGWIAILVMALTIVTFALLPDPYSIK